MSKLLPKEAAIEYQRRWQAVHEAEVDEMRQTPLAVKFRQLSVLVGSRTLFAVPPSWSVEDTEVLDRWNRLRTHYGNLSPERD
jgi:hypothetical protein